jgi:hypothetical protein
MLLKFKITYKKFSKLMEFEIEAFSLPSAIEKFYANFPHTKILLIEEVMENEPQ